jgi:hypothetical protein
VRFSFKSEQGKLQGLTIFSSVLTVTLIGLSAFFATWGHAQSVGTTRTAYDRCRAEYSAMEERIASGSARPTDNLSTKYTECVGLYNQMISSTGPSRVRTGSQSADVWTAAYEDCREEYTVMKERLLHGSARPTDNLSSKYSECVDLYNRLRSSQDPLAQARAGRQPENAREAYERCQHEYNAMENEQKLHPTQPTGSLHWKKAECAALYNQMEARFAYEDCLRSMQSGGVSGPALPTADNEKQRADCAEKYFSGLASEGVFPVRINGPESVSISEPFITYTLDLPIPPEVRSASPDYYVDGWIGNTSAGRWRPGDRINVQVPRKVGKYIVKMDVRFATGKSYIRLARGQKELEVTGVAVTVTLTRAGSNDAVTGWAQLDGLGVAGSAVHRFTKVAPGTYTLLAGAAVYKEKKVRLTVREKDMSTTLKLEPSANFKKVTFYVMDKRGQNWVQNASVSVASETKQGAAPSFSLVEARTFPYLVTAPGYVKQSGSLQVGKAGKQPEQIQYIYLEPAPRGNEPVAAPAGASAAGCRAAGGVIDTVTVRPNKQGKSNIVLESGQWYFMEASGFVSYWKDNPGDYVDAAYCFAQWRCPTPAYWGPLIIDGYDLDWHYRVAEQHFFNYSPRDKIKYNSLDHTYKVCVEGNGRQLEFWTKGETGTITVKISRAAGK